MTALARKMRKLPPELAERVRLKPHEYVEVVGAHITGSETASARLCYLVLHAIAERADWQSWSWGAHSFGSVENIAEQIRYSPRSVRYALTALTDAEEVGGVRSGRWLHIQQRSGGTNLYTVLRPVEALQVPKRDSPASPVDEQPPKTALVAVGTATVAANLDTPTRDTPPVVPPTGLGMTMAGADAPTQAAPQWRGDATTAASAAAAPSPAEVRAKPHQRDAGGPAAFGPAALDLVTAAAASDGTVAAPADPTRDGPRSYRLARKAARTRPCPRCHAEPNEPCVTVRGRPRTSTHNERRVPDLTPHAPTWPDAQDLPRRVAWCRRCYSPDLRLLEDADGVIRIPCPECHPSRTAPSPF